MSTNTAAVFTLALCFAAATAASGQEPIVKTASVSGTATIQAIDSTARTITLRNQAGEEDTYAVGPEVKRFNEMKVGDTVKMTYMESLVLQIRRPGDKPGPATIQGGVTPGTGALPSATVAAQAKMTVTVKAIDPKVPSITVTTPDSRTVTRKVENKKNLEGVKVGDQIDITYTRSLLTAIERAK
jgi:Cu/Ag efflux protein CusF